MDSKCSLYGKKVLCILLYTIYLMRRKAWNHIEKYKYQFLIKIVQRILTDKPGDVYQPNVSSKMWSVGQGWSLGDHFYAISNLDRESKAKHQDENI